MSKPKKTSLEAWADLRAAGQQVTIAFFQSPVGRLMIRMLDRLEATLERLTGRK